jgi:hypothetical protein
MVKEPVQVLQKEEVNETAETNEKAQGRFYTPTKVKVNPNNDEFLETINARDKVAPVTTPLNKYITPAERKRTSKSIMKMNPEDGPSFT